MEIVLICQPLVLPFTLIFAKHISYTVESFVKIELLTCDMTQENSNFYQQNFYRSWLRICVVWSFSHLDRSFSPDNFKGGHYGSHFSPISFIHKFHIIFKHFFFFLGGGGGGGREENFHLFF